MNHDQNKNQNDICANCGGTVENPSRFDQLKAAHGSSFALAPTSLVCEECGGSGEIPATTDVLAWEKDGDTGKRKRFLGYFGDRADAESSIHWFHYQEMLKNNAADCAFEEMDKTIDPNFWEIKEGYPVIVSRPAHGISLNGDEVLLDAENKSMIFASVVEAKEFLKENGCEDADLEGFNFTFSRRQSGILPVFSLIYASGDQVHASNGIAGQIRTNYWFVSLRESDQKFIGAFLDNAEIGETLFCDGTLILRLKEDMNVACECCD